MKTSYLLKTLKQMMVDVAIEGKAPYYRVFSSGYDDLRVDCKVKFFVDSYDHFNVVFYCTMYCPTLKMVHTDKYLIDLSEDEGEMLDLDMIKYDSVKDILCCISYHLERSFFIKRYDGNVAGYIHDGKYRSV